MNGPPVIAKPEGSPTGQTATAGMPPEAKASAMPIAPPELATLTGVYRDADASEPGGVGNTSPKEAGQDCFRRLE